MKSLTIAFGIGMVALSAATEAWSEGSYRFHSPAKNFDVVLQKLPNDWTSVMKGQAGVAKEAMKLYGIDFYPVHSSQSVNSMVYSDVGEAPPPEEIVASMVWSPNEAFVILPDRRKAREADRVLLLVASLSTNKVWGLEAEHARWVDDRRFVGDLRTKDLPGAVIQFDGSSGKAEVLIQPESGLGYRVASVAGPRVTIASFLNDRGTGRTTWEKYEPACFELNLDTFKKRSTACPPTLP